MEERLTLRELQERHCEQIIREPATLVALPLGTGKTTIAVEAVFRTKETNRRILVVAPRNTEFGWRRTVLRQYGETLHGDLLFRRMDSTTKGARAINDFWGGKEGWYFVTWEWFRTRSLDYWKRVDVDVIILDEVQRMANRNSKTWKHVRGMGKSAKRIAMSGLFTGNRMEGAWTTLRWLFPEDTNTANYYTTPLSFWNWVRDWLITETNDYMGFTEVKGEAYEPGTMMSYYESYIHEADISEVPAVNDIRIEVGMSSEQKKLYKQMNDELVMWLSTADPLTGQLPVISELPVTKRMRLRQITLGVPSINEENRVNYNVDTISPKLDAAIEELTYLADTEPVLVFTHSRGFAVVAAQRFEKAGYPAFAWVGGTTDKQRRKAVESWGSTVQVIVAQIQAIAEGTDGLQDYCSEEIWLSELENMELNFQAKGRLPRTGQTKVVNRRMIVVPGTYDDKILDKHVADRLALNQSLKGAS